MTLVSRIGRALRPAFSLLKRTVRRVWRCRRRWSCWPKRGLVLFLGATVIPVLVFRWVPPPISSVMAQRMVQEWAWQDYRWVPVEEIAPVAALAVVAAEDQMFPDHNGFDLDAIMAAVQHNLEGGRLRGASTITQQVAKNLFLWEGRSWVRKAMEAWLTALLEVFWSKQRILEVYLNIAEMGDRTFGVEAASRRFFRHAAADLTAREAATLAAVLPNPGVYRVEAPTAAVLKRRDWVLQQMRQLGGVGYLGSMFPRS